MQSSAADFLTYFNIIWKRLWLTILLFLVTVGVILAISYTADPVYRATVRLQVLATDQSDVSLFTQYRATSTEADILQAQNDFIRLLKSGTVAWETIADLNLEIGALDLLAGLSTTTEGDFVIVTVESDDPGRAEDIATYQVNNAVAQYREGQARAAKALLEFTTVELEIEERNMLDAEKAILAFKHRNNLDSIELETHSLQDSIRALKLERERALIERDKADIYAKLYRQLEQDALDEIETINEIEAERATEGDAESDSGTGFAPQTKQYYLDQARHHAATAANYEGRRDGQTRSLEIYDAMIAERTTELKSVLSLYSEYNALQRDLTRASNNYSFLWGRANDARLMLSQAEELGYIQITEPARKPDAPVPSKTLQLAAVGGAASILFGFVLSFLLEFLSSLIQAARRQRVR